MQKKYEDLGRAYKEKSRKLLQIQEMYDRARRQTELGQMHAAASDNVQSYFQNPKLKECDRAKTTRPPAPGLFEQQVQVRQPSDVEPNKFSHLGHQGFDQQTIIMRQGEGETLQGRYPANEGAWRRPLFSSHGTF